MWIDLVVEIEEPYCLTLSLASCSKVLHCRGLEGGGNKLGLSVYPERPLEKSMIPSTNCFVPYHERTLNIFRAGLLNLSWVWSFDQMLSHSAVSETQWRHQAAPGSALLAPSLLSFHLGILGFLLCFISFYIFLRLLCNWNRILSLTESYPSESQK